MPAALTVDRYNAIRLATLLVFVLVLAIPALVALNSAARTSWARACGRRRPRAHECEDVASWEEYRLERAVGS